MQFGWVRLGVCERCLTAPICDCGSLWTDHPNAVYRPRWFRRERDPVTGQLMYRYTHEYWQCKRVQDWSRCPDIFLWRHLSTSGRVSVSASAADHVRVAADRLNSAASVEPRPSALNMTLPAFAAERRRSQEISVDSWYAAPRRSRLSIDISKPAAHCCCYRSIELTDDRRTDTRPLHRPWRRCTNVAIEFHWQISAVANSTPRKIPFTSKQTTLDLGSRPDRPRYRPC